jgi:hypothetical protein
MTLLLTWAAFDHGNPVPAAVYVAADSRVSWGGSAFWDNGQKVFAVSSGSEIFGYCGDVVAISQTLGQIVQLSNLRLFDQVGASDLRATLYGSLIAKSISGYPQLSSIGPSSVIYARAVPGNISMFQIDVRRDFSVDVTGLALPKSGKNWHVLGTGASKFKQDAKLATSYEAFHRFCDCVAEREPATVGGIPQLAALRRNGKASIIGIHWGNRNNALGMNLDDVPGLATLEWKNENFERWDVLRNELGPVHTIRNPSAMSAKLMKANTCC